MRRLRTLTVGFLTPFYFLRAGTLVSLPALFAAPLVFLSLLAGKVAAKIFGLYPLIGVFLQDSRERWFYTLLMSTGLTFGTISALFGLNHGLVDRDQYSLLVAAVLASAPLTEEYRSGRVKQDDRADQGYEREHQRRAE